MDTRTFKVERLLDQKLPATHPIAPLIHRLARRCKGWSEGAMARVTRLSDGAFHFEVVE